MCNQKHRLQYFAPHWDNKLAKDIFPQWVMASYPPEIIREKHCIICKRPMTDDEIQPSDRLTPRCMHDSCYQNEIVTKINYNCFLTGVPLPPEKIHEQQLYPREVENNIADGYPQDYYTYIANIVFGC